MDFTQSMDNGYMIPTSVAVGSGEATDIRCVCDTVEDFKTFLDTTDMELRYEGLITYEKVNKLLKVYKGNDTWQTVGEGGGEVDLSGLGADLSLNGRTLKLKNADGVEIGTGVTLPQTSGGSSMTDEEVTNVLTSVFGESYISQ